MLEHPISIQPQSPTLIAAPRADAQAGCCKRARTSSRGRVEGENALPMQRDASSSMSLSGVLTAARAASGM